MDIESPLEKKAEEELRKNSGGAGMPFELAVADTPKSRSILFGTELEIANVGTWLEIAQRSAKGFSQNADRYFDSQVEFTQVLSPELIPDGMINREIFDLLLQTSTNMEKLHRRLNIDLKNFILGTLNKLAEEDIKNLREEKKRLDKMADKYSTALSRFSQTTNKNTAQAEEEAFMLYEVRMTYINASIDYLALFKKISSSIEVTSSQKFLEYLEAEANYYKKANDLFTEAKPKIDALKAILEKKREEHTNNTTQIDSQVIHFKEFSASTYKPLRSNEFHLETLIHKRTVKEGFLWKKLTKGITRWDRRYFILSNQTLSYRVFTPERGIRGIVISNNVGTCIIKSIPTEKTDRRFCFEIEAKKQTWILQAENEMEYRDWLLTLENAAIHSQQNFDEIKEQVGNENRKSEESDLSSSSKRSSMASPPQEKEIIKYPNPEFEVKNKELHDILKSIPLTDFVFDACAIILLREVPVHGRIYVTQNRIVFYANFLKIITTHVIYISEITSIETNKKEGVLQRNLEIQTASQKFAFSLRKPRDWDLREVIVKIWMWLKDQKDKTDMPLTKVQEFYDSLYKNYNRDHKEEDGSESEEEEEAEKSDQGSTLETIPVPPEVQLPQAEVQPFPEFEPLPEPLLNEVIPVSVQKLNAILFDANEPLWSKYIQKRGYLNPKAAEWAPNAEGQLQRMFEYLTPISLPMVKATSTEAYENQTYLKKEDFIRYTIDIRTQTPNVPYGDTFETHIRYQLTFVSKTSSRINISLAVDFKKSTAFKGMVKGGVVKGVQVMAADLFSFLKKETKAVRSTKGGADQAEAEAEEEKEEAEANGKTKKASFLSSLPVSLPTLIFGGFLLLSLIFNLVFVFSSSKSCETVLPQIDSPHSSLNRELIKIIDVENDSLDWASLEQRLQEKAYISMRSHLSDLRGEVMQLYQVINHMEERVFQAQAVNLIFDRVKDCQAKFSLKTSNRNGKISPEEEGCLRIEFLLKEFLQNELARVGNETA